MARELSATLGAMTVRQLIEQLRRWFYRAERRRAALIAKTRCHKNGLDALGLAIALEIAGKDGLE